jgi:hypothetical protein
VHADGRTWYPLPSKKRTNSLRGIFLDRQNVERTLTEPDWNLLDDLPQAFITRARIRVGLSQARPHAFAPRLLWAQSA